MSTFELDGFLSQEANQYGDQISSAFSELIGEARGASREATIQLTGLKLKDPAIATLVGLSLWSRCIASCQGAILLGQRGMGVESLTLLRNALESLFHCAALFRDSSALKRLRSKDDYERLKQATALLGHQGTVDVLTPENNTAVRAFIEDTQPPKDLMSAFECAKAGGLEGLYHGAYRSLSLVAAHPSLTTAGRAFGDHLLDLRFGPSAEDLNTVFELARDFLKIGRGYVDEMLTSREGNYQVRGRDGTLLNSFPASDRAQAEALTAAGKIERASVWRFDGTNKAWQPQQ